MTAGASPGLALAGAVGHTGEHSGMDSGLQGGLTSLAQTELLNHSSVFYGSDSATSLQLQPVWFTAF